MVDHLIIIPSIGGSNIMAKKMITPAKYTPYLTAFFDESISNVSMILCLDNCFFRLGSVSTTLDYASFHIRALS